MIFKSVARHCHLAGGMVCGCRVQLGLSPTIMRSFTFNTIRSGNTGFHDGLAAYPNGHSKRWVCRSRRFSGNDAGIVALPAGTTGRRVAGSDYTLPGNYTFTADPAWSPVHSHRSRAMVGSMKTTAGTARKIHAGAESHDFSSYR